MQIDEAKEILKNAGRSLVSEENVQLSDKFRTAWNSLMSAMSDFTNWNRVVMWYAWDKYEKKATSLSEAYARGQYSLHEIIEKMKSAGSEWYRDLLGEINAILKKNLEVTGDRGEFSYGDKSYKIVPVCNSVGSKCSFEIRENSDEDEVFKRTPFIENPDEALDALETLIEESFNTELSEAKEVLKKAGFLVEANKRSAAFYYRAKVFAKIQQIFDERAAKARGTNQNVRGFKVDTLKSYIRAYGYQDLNKLLNGEFEAGVSVQEAAEKCIDWFMDIVKREG